MEYDHNVQIDLINKPFRFVDFCDDMLFSIFSFLTIDDLITTSRIYKPLKYKKNKWIWKEFAIRDAMTVFDQNIPTIQNALNAHLTNAEQRDVMLYRNILDLIDRCKLNYIYGRPSVLPVNVRIDLYSSNISIDRILDMIIGVDPKYNYLNHPNINQSYSGQLVDIGKVVHFVIRSLMPTNQPSVCIALLYNKLKHCIQTSDPYTKKIIDHVIKSMSDLLSTNLHLLSLTIDDLKALKNHDKRLRMDTDCIVQEKNRRV